jgi:hypothetical protein
MVSFQGAGEPITRDELLSVVDSLGLKVPELLALIEVETKGSGFLPDRRPRILFERHVFSRLTGHRFDAEYSDISAPTPGGYKGGAAEYPRIERAVALDPVAAFESASWGVGQIMGFNFNCAGYTSIEEMTSMSSS